MFNDPFEDFFNNNINRSDVIDFEIPAQDFDLLKINAEKAAIGGKSQIRKNESRKNFLHEDQLVGQIANYAASVVLTKSSDGYKKAREIANNNPYKGDNGIDIIGLPNIDVKGSLMRRSVNPLDYRLLVRPHERHKNWIYILCLVPPTMNKCFIVGWIEDENLPEKTYDGEIQSLHGAYVVQAKNLKKISDLKFYKTPHLTH